MKRQKAKENKRVSSGKTQGSSIFYALALSTTIFLALHSEQLQKSL